MNISVIIPTLNEEKYIENCLKALSLQDYKDFEIIVVDSNSKDKTVKIAKKYTDKVIVTKRKGVSYARNLGAKHANGKILLFLDADTIPSFNLLKEIAKAFRKKDVVGATCYVFPYPPDELSTFYFIFYNIFSRASLKVKPQIAGIVCAYRKDIFFKVGGFNEKLKILEDFDLSERISKYGKIKFLKDAYVLTSNRRIEHWGKLKSPFKYLGIYALGKVIGKEKVSKIINYEPIR